MRAVAAAATLSLVLPLCICGANLAAAHTSPPGAHASVRTTPLVLHRVVWATPNVAGIHLTSAKGGGSGLRHIYNSKSGAVLYLSLDRQGRRVAFAPWFTDDRDPLPVMEVVPVLGGKVKKPLASYPSKFDWVAGIGWSPSGRRLAFEGGTLNRRHVHSALWTVRLNGTGLHRILTLPSPKGDPGTSEGPLVWTRHGIMYVSDSHDLRIVRHGASRLVLRHVFAVRISGNGQHIVTWRAIGPGHPESIWYGDPDGTRQHRMARWPWPNSGTAPPGAAPGYYDATPNHDGSRILAERDVGPVVWWKKAQSPKTASVIPVAGKNYPVTWN